MDTIDDAAPDATYIKLDVEGAGLGALKGAAGTIEPNRPKFAVCLYHKPGDLFEIPLYIKSLVHEYRFFLRQHQPVSCELVLYKDCLVFEICNPLNPKAVLEADMEISTALPCRVSVYTIGRRTKLATLSPVALLSVFGKPELSKVAEEVQRTIYAIMAAAAVP